MLFSLSNISGKFSEVNGVFLVCFGIVVNKI